jgi:hypothetical protein
MSKSLTETAKAILESANAETLKPKSKSADAPQTLGTATKIADDPKKPGDGSNVGAAAAAPIKTDSSAPKKNAKPAEPAQHLEEDEEVEADEMMAEDEEVEISEELAAFIDQMIEEGADEDEIAAAIEENFEVIEEEIEDDLQEEDETEELEEEASYTVDMSEHVNALFEGESLSEEFRAKALTIFEAAVNTKLQEEVANLEEAFAETLAEEVEAIQEELASNVDDYLNYVVEQWVSENEVAIEAGLRTELTEEFISGLRQLFAENFIDIPDEKVSVVEELAASVEELQNKLNEEIERNVELSKVLAESKKSEVLHTVVEGLTDTQADKLKTLAENIEFTDAEEFASKITTLRESYFPTSVNAQQELDPVDATAGGKSMISEELNGPMAAYVRTLGKSLPK